MSGLTKISTAGIFCHVALSDPYTEKDQTCRERKNHGRAKLIIIPKVLLSLIMLVIEIDGKFEAVNAVQLMGIKCDFLLALCQCVL